MSLDIIGSVAVLITVAGSTTYLMGIIALAWPIYARITHDATLSWHAVALIPKTVVAGQGARILFSFPLMTTASTLVYLTFLAFYVSLVTASVDSGVLVLILIAVPVVAVFPIGFKLFAHPSIAWLLGPEADEPVSKLVRYTTSILGYGLAWSAGPMWLIAGFSVEWTGIIPQITVHGKWFVLSIVLMFVGAFILGLEEASAIHPPLPHVEIFGSDEADNVTGRLVAHVDGVWHFFTESDLFASVPDDKVRVVFTGPGKNAGSS